MHDDLTDEGARQNGVNIMNTLTRKLRDAKPGDEMKIFAVAICISIHEFCIQNDEFCIQNDEFNTKQIPNTVRRMN